MSRSKPMLILCLVSIFSLGAPCPAQQSTADSDQQSDANGPPLTDRERMLLDRINTLEKRVEALESKTR